MRERRGELRERERLEGKSERERKGEGMEREREGKGWRREGKREGELGAFSGGWSSDCNERINGEQLQKRVRDEVY